MGTKESSLNVDRIYNLLVKKIWQKKRKKIVGMSCFFCFVCFQTALTTCKGNNAASKNIQPRTVNVWTNELSTILMYNIKNILLS